MPIFPASRLAHIAPFHVMELLTRAKALEAAGRDIVHMEIGEPDFPTPEPIVAAAQAQIASGRVFYTPALGLPELRAAIAGFYATRYAIDIPASRIVVTAGASGALLLTMACLAEAGSEWLLADPGYPCNRNFVRSFEGLPVSIPVRAENNFQPTLAEVEAHWTARTAGALLASPANPTGTLIDDATLAAIASLVRRKGGQLVVDEIYHGLTYERAATTALAFGDDIFVVQSFSKFFNMTGWRLGWLVVPERYTREIEKLAQNLFISPSTPAQHAALAAFSPATLAILETRRQEFKRRRDFLAPALENLGFRQAAKPEGAFYVYANCSKLTDNSDRFARDLLEAAGVAVTPGLDFGRNDPEKYLRFAYTASVERLTEAVDRIRRFLG
ncbi:MAG: Aspartate aminotransferase [Candidatus Accumulibacter regalis]|jgi:aspartate/methionine/tyrosine aminotransferase|uniref:Aminotransferase n=1 Tax=Accumulibacter regalis TaxID=522306 RepID=A0A011PKI3_ACCRE|nr:MULTISPECIES: pyridoxal phosphate-dependent aminotransferase [unclassified Candidatus Accumulibacter]EXI87991.1 MAG: Aspartate aminotransferase [Candidatus Accumulibacter regalis]MQM34915.1 pyridoxal phosphate-dependent aminotransferase [Candidatus Accumulibacter phosphatis]MBL8366748.1 pyridoxal phosphate-dependent aminotransferase [Accumulibacter sp.]MBN8513074.1 pyridoxal phosphate-dependent aminotransferase [Accumulibacter sp.]MBO3700978.1 pyridoxal phosphate-dependent aminotransferase 